MKIAISSSGTNLDSMIDPRFGRCQYFIYVDPDTLQFESVDNPGLMASGGAGIATAQAISAKGAEVVITGNCGPNAYQVLSAAGIKLITGVSGKIKDAVQDYKAGKFQASSQPDVPGHFGTGRGAGGEGRGMGHGCTGRG
jgi:predicted Fe-Mo cluster-binding NifX family protein